MKKNSRFASIEPKIYEPSIQVVCAIIEKNSKILAAKRSIKEKHAPGLWELPGGKVKNGETTEDALQRELFEELNIFVQIDSLFMTHYFYNAKRSIQLISYRCKIVKGSIRLTVHDKVLWIDSTAANLLKWSKPDIPIVKKYFNIPI